MPFYTFPYPSICIKKGGTKEGTKMASANKLTNAFIKTADVGKHLDGAGLFFRKRKTGSADWLLRFRLNGKRHEMGLGGSKRRASCDSDLAAHHQGFSSRPSRRVSRSSTRLQQ